MAKTYKLPPITDHNIIKYMKAQYRDKKEQSKMLGNFAFRNWQDYLNNTRLTNQLITKKDMANFIYILENDRQRTAITIANYLGQLAPFFYFENLKELGDFAKEQRNMLVIQAREEKKYHPILGKDLKTVYEKASKKGRVLIRLLLFESISISELARVSVSVDADKYALYNDRTELELNSKETLDTVKEMIKSNELAENEQFFTSRRGLADYIKRLTNSNLGYPITSMNLRKFGRYMHKDDLNSWLSKADTCPTCGRKLSF